jgi:hypothetical protein
MSEPLEAALRAAEYFGAECEANPGSTMSDYTYDMALRVGHKEWNDVPSATKRALTKAFLEGRKAERELTRR